MNRVLATPASLIGSNQATAKGVTMDEKTLHGHHEGCYLQGLKHAYIAEAILTGVAAITSLVRNKIKKLQ